jgi:dipeptidase D
MHLVRETYQRLFNKTPNIQIIHAGLECGLFKNRIRIWIWFLSGQPSPVRTPG